MKIKSWLMALALPAVLAGSGCYVHGRGAVAYAYTDPPPPRYTYVDVRPGYVWVDGYWYWNANNWLWRDGYYVADRPGYVYVQGNYANRRYRPGYWAPRHRDTVYVQPRGTQAPARLHVSPQRSAPQRVVIPGRR